MVIYSHINRLVCSIMAKVIIHPLVPLQLLNSYIRDSSLYFGPLFGIENNGVLEVTYSYSLAQFDESAAAEAESTLTVITENHKNINKKETLIGWYLLGELSTKQFFQYFNYFSSFRKRNELFFIHSPLTDDAQTFHYFGRFVSTSQIGKVQNEFISSASQGKTLTLASILDQLPTISLETKISSLEEKVTMSVLSSSAESLLNPAHPTLLESQAKTVRAALLRLRELLEFCIAYVDDVVAGRVKQPNETFGRFMLATLRAIPTLDRQEFGQAFTAHMQDMLMASYLTNLARLVAALSSAAVTK